MYVYAVSDPDGNVKIGYTRRDFNTRIIQLTRSEGRPLKFLGVEKLPDGEAARRREKAIHHVFRPWRCRGREWFRITETQLFEQFKPENGLKLRGCVMRCNRN
jgi:predicted GIY-YIG superfamily endonuclease